MHRTSVLAKNELGGIALDTLVGENEGRSPCVGDRPCFHCEPQVASGLEGPVSKVLHVALVAQ